MLIPVRCWSCGKVIAHVYEQYKQAVESGEDARGEELHLYSGEAVALFDVLDNVEAHVAAEGEVHDEVCELAVMESCGKTEIHV